MPEPLTLQSRCALARAVELCERDYALRALAETLDPGATLSTWQLAGRLSDRIKRFRSTAYPRIQKGHRSPQSATELALLAIVGADCPQSARRLYDLLAELGF